MTDPSSYHWGRYHLPTGCDRLTKVVLLHDSIGMTADASLRFRDWHRVGVEVLSVFRFNVERRPVDWGKSDEVIGWVMMAQAGSHRGIRINELNHQTIAAASARAHSQTRARDSQMTVRCTGHVADNSHTDTARTHPLSHLPRYTCCRPKILSVAAM